jgi:hypothetical protein
MVEEAAQTERARRLDGVRQAEYLRRTGIVEPLRHLAGAEDPDDEAIAHRAHATLAARHRSSSSGCARTQRTMSGAE